MFEKSFRNLRLIRDASRKRVPPYEMATSPCGIFHLDSFDVVRYAALVPAKSTHILQKAFFRHTLTYYTEDMAETQILL